MEGSTRSCSQCHKEVAEANFALHETHCSRFLCVCPDCDEAVPREHLDKHKEDQHSEVSCSKCFKKMEHRHLQDHESDECVERLQTCQFCELDLPWKELDQHDLACGSRTELCRDCGRYVKLRDKQDHGLTCSAANNDPSPPQTTSSPLNKTKQSVTCRKCKASFPADDIDTHELDCNTAKAQLDEEDEEDEEEDFSAQVPRLSSTYKAGNSWSSGGDPNEISTCPHCHLALPLITLRWHEGKCRRTQSLDMKTQ